ATRRRLGDSYLVCVARGAGACHRRTDRRRRRRDLRRIRLPLRAARDRGVGARRDAGRTLTGGGVAGHAMAAIAAPAEAASRRDAGGESRARSCCRVLLGPGVSETG